MINRAPAPDGHDPAVARMAAAAELHRLDLDGMPNMAGDSFVRYWPPGPGNGSPGDGNTLGFLRYLTRNAAAPLQCDCAGGYSLTLDRMFTAPNAAIGVTFLSPSPYKSNWIVLYPGDTIYVPGGFERFWIYNADYVDLLTGPVPSSKPLGFCSFLIGTRRNGAAPVQAGVHPGASTIAIGYSGTAQDVYVPMGRLRHLGIEFSGATAANTFVPGSAIVSTSIGFLPLHAIPSGAGQASAVANDTETVEVFGGLAANSVARTRVYRIPLMGVTVSAGLFRLTVPTGAMMRFTVDAVTAWDASAITRVQTRIQGFPG